MKHVKHGWRVIVLAICSMALVQSVAAGNDDEVPELSVPHSEGIALPIDVVFEHPQREPDAPPPHPAIPIWSHSEPRPGAKMMQFQLSDIAYDANDPFRIEIVDASGMIVESINGDTIGDRTTVWTNLGIGNSLGIRVFGNREEKLAFTIAKVSFDKAGRTLESITEPDERQHLYEYTGSHEAAVSEVRGAVAKLSYMVLKNGKLVRDVCTGFLVGEDLLMTNEHCVADAERCLTTKAIFGFTWDRHGRTPDLMQYACKKVELVDHDHDFAVLRLTGSPGIRWGQLSFAPLPPQNDQAVFVLQHPAGEAKQISDIGCRVVEAIAPGRADDTDFSHGCDTLSGSSGSPIIDTNGQVVGLHHWGRTSFGTYALVNRAVRGERIVPLVSTLLEAQSRQDPEEEPTIEANNNDDETESETSSQAQSEDN